MTLSKHQQFTPRRVQRSAIKNALYNPRLPLSKEKAARLRENLSRVGLVEPLIWNKRTGNLVGGHQRLAQLDALEGGADFELDVAEVDLDPRIEREQNIFLNNPAVHGDWDLTALRQLFREPNVDPERAGFTEPELRDVFGDAIAAEFEQAPVTAPSFERPQPAATADQAPRAAAAVAPAAPIEIGGTPQLLVYFEGRAQREAFMQAMGMSDDDRYLDASRVLMALGVDASQEWAQAYGS